MGMFDDKQTDDTLQEFEDKSPEEFMAELVGEDKQYKTVAEAVRALAHTKHHAKKVELENKTLRDKTAQSATIEDIMAQLKGSGDGTPAGDNKDLGVNPEKSTPQGQPEDIRELVTKMFQEQQTTQSAQRNKDEVTAKLTSMYGDKAGTVWAKAEQELGVDLESIAAKSPAAVYKMLGMSEGQQSGSAAPSFNGDAPRKQQDSSARPPEGSLRLLDWQLAKGEIDKKTHTALRYNYAMDPAKYRA